MTEVKDLTYSKNQRKIKTKEIIRSDGTKEKVPFPFWRATVLRDPLGATAQEAAKVKDPDLEKIRVENIPIKTFLESPIVDVEEKATPISQSIIQRPIIAGLNVETAKRIGFRSAEEGKTKKK